ncbi:hypothetical protein RmaAA213_15890 [Rhodothermus marinus]|nr:hypothetical protein RmaAA213_15890 [Rhodothermus marinus]BBM72728.1 hypothetical protein RmaAA338_15930 [Rhodothermus marinus]
MTLHVAQKTHYLLASDDLAHTGPGPDLAAKARVLRALDQESG